MHGGLNELRFPALSTYSTGSETTSECLPLTFTLGEVAAFGGCGAKGYELNQ